MGKLATRRALGILAWTGSLGVAAFALAGCRTEVVVEERHRPPPRREVVVVEEQPVYETRCHEAPPVVRVEEVTVCPGPRAEYFWIGGHWQWQGGRWVWYGGHWHRRPRAEAVYISGRWEPHSGGGYIWIAGRWN